MAERSWIVGQGDCTTRKLVQILSDPKSKSFELLVEKWEDVFNDLEINRVAIKQARLNQNLGIDTLKSRMIEMLDIWVGENGSKAHLRKLLNALKLNGMEALAEHLTKEAGYMNNQTKNYCRYPPALKEFFKDKDKFYTIISTLDASITCKKVEENSNSLILTTEEFLSLTSKNWIPDPPTIFVVTVMTLDEVEEVLDAAKNINIPEHKLLIISQDSQEKLVGKISKTHPSIHQFVKDEMEWEDLSPLFKREIRKRLKEIGNSSKSACGQVLVQLINQAEIKLFENTIPEDLLVNYYIPRKIIPRNRLDQEKLFHNNSTDDIFVFSKIEKRTLSGYVKGTLTNTSFELLGKKENKTRFATLEESRHFPEICSKTYKSVHLIEFKNGEFYWVKTCRKIETIQNMLKMTTHEEYKEDNDLEHLQETDFVDKVIASDDTKVVCLSDTPGMGKSVLLASIAKQLKGKRDYKTPVIFLPINNLIEKMKALDKESLKSALHLLVCKTSLEKEIISEKLTSSELEIELLLDGFDEVEWKRSDFALRLLHFLQKECTSIRIWISTRPQHLEKLEQTLTTIGFNIRPFIKEDQMLFLKSFWLSKNKDLSQDKLKEFALKVLEKFSTSTSRGGQGSTNEVEIAGIPLQCLMLAKVCEENAVISCRSTKCGSVMIDLFVLQDIDCIATLYEKLIEIKFQKYEKTYSTQGKLDRTSLYSMHYKLAFQLIFPNLVDNIIADFFKETPNIEELLNVGLLERKHACPDSNNFIHRTFAEYFCAHFVADEMTKNYLLSCDGRFINFLFDEFLSISLDDEKDYSKFSFRNFVPCYFLNCLISSSILSSSASNITLPSKNISSEEIRIFLIVCSNHNLQTLFKLFTDHPNFKENVCDIIDEELFLYSIKQHEFEMFKIILDHFKSHSKLTARLSSRALYAAVKRVDAKKLEHFLKVEKVENRKLFDVLLGDPGVELNRLFREYFYQIDKVCQSSVGTANAIDMIDLLVQTDETMQNKMLSPSCPKKRLLDCYQKNNWGLALLNKWTPLQIHLELIKLGADLYQRDINGNNFLHLYATFDKKFMQYFEEISAPEPPNISKCQLKPEKLTKLLQMKNKDGLNPLASAFKNKIQLSVKCLEMFKKAGVDFSEVFKGKPLFLLAIQSGNGEEVLEFMIENGVDVYGRKRTYLDCAVAVGNIIAVRLLVNKFKFDVNGPNMNSRSQLDDLFQIWNTDLSEKYFIMAHELWNLGGRLQQTTPEDLKKKAFYRKDLNILRFVLEKYLKVNEKDSEGNTLLHLVAKSWPDAIKLVLEFGADKSEKNKLELTPLDVALKSAIYLNDIKNVQILKPSDEFDWSSVSFLVTSDDFKAFLEESSWSISDWNECLPLFQEALKRIAIESTDTNLHFWLESLDLSPPHFNSLIEYLCTNVALVEKLKTRDGNRARATLLHYALQRTKGIEEKTLKRLQKLIDFKVKDKKGKSLLFYAVEGEQTPEFLALLHKYGGGDFDDKDNNGHGLLHVIVTGETRDIDMVKFLLKKGVDPNSADRNGDTLLHLLFRHISETVEDGSEIDWYSEIAKLLLEAGAKPENKNQNGDTVFDFAWNIIKSSDSKSSDSESSDSESRPVFAKVFRLIWKFRDSSQGLSFTPSSFIKNKITEILFGDCETLTDEEFVYFTNDILKLKNSMTSDRPEDDFPFTEWKIYLTSSNFHLLVENLIQKGQADMFFSLAQIGMRALHYVVSTITVEERTLKLLQKLENETDQNGIILGVKDENGWSLLFQAINRNWTRLKDFKLLEKYGGGAMTDKDNSGKNLLHVAVEEFLTRDVNNLIVVEYLLNNVGLDPNEVDNQGNTPLHILFAQTTFVDYEHITKTRVFIEAGAKVNFPNSKGETAAELARQNIMGSEEFKEHLLAILSSSENS